VDFPKRLHLAEKELILCHRNRKYNEARVVLGLVSARLMLAASSKIKEPALRVVPWYNMMLAPVYRMPPEHESSRQKSEIRCSLNPRDA